MVNNENGEMPENLMAPQVGTEKKNLRQYTNNYKAKPQFISLEIVEKIILDCVTWEEAKPHVDLLEKLYGIDPPPQVKASIKRIKRKFDMKIHRRIIKAKQVVMKNNRIEAMNKITKNKNVKL